MNSMISKIVSADREAKQSVETAGLERDKVRQQAVNARSDFEKKYFEQSRLQQEEYAQSREKELEEYKDALKLRCAGAEEKLKEAFEKDRQATGDSIFLRITKKEK